MKRQAMLAAALGLLLMPAVAGAECAWVLWNKTSTYTEGSKEGLASEWSPITALPSHDNCETNLGPYLKAKLEMLKKGVVGEVAKRAGGKIEHDRSSITVDYGEIGFASFEYSCFPDTIDPRSPKQ